MRDQMEQDPRIHYFTAREPDGVKIDELFICRGNSCPEGPCGLAESLDCEQVRPRDELICMAQAIRCVVLGDPTQYPASLSIESRYDEKL